MKKNFKNLLLAAAALLLACSFAELPSSTGTAPEESAFSATPVGGAYLMFAGKFGGDITKREMEGQQELKVEGCAKGSGIFKFSLDVTKGGKTTSLPGESNVLTKEMLAKLMSLSPGDEFEFSHVKARLPKTGDVVDVHGKKFTVVGKGA